MVLWWVGAWCGGWVQGVGVVEGYCCFLVIERILEGRGELEFVGFGLGWFLGLRFTLVFGVTESVTFKPSLGPRVSTA